ncbi:E3 ubiquitin-protein ligase RHA2A [Morus notabilis]|uniref:E3 ubiquitin-protein ligase RHA2A n=1 Tax=Morus notabilis TaxID=981085 RepID=W9RN53_9ROSA|nr:probable E3 ubiquitin-protein ligase XERICO [Morus notabilis]EXB82546.1 E3 ubiquitin-protein ligase RHA2A [Morus notabilis]
MGLSNFPTAAEGVLPVLVMNSVLSVTLLKNMVRSVIQVMCGANYVNSSNVEEDPDDLSSSSSSSSSSSAEAVSRERRISITQFKSLCQNRSCDAKNSTSSSISGISGSTSSSSSTNTSTSECCVCFCGFEADEEVSELSCKHFFHKNCLDKWFHNKHTTCPLCRSID